MRAFSLGLLWQVGIAAWTLSSPGALVAQSEASFQGWNVQYSLPADWFVRQTVGRLHIVSSESKPGGIFLAVGLYESFGDVGDDLQVLARLANLVGAPVEGPADTTIAGMPGAVAVYAAQSRSGERLRGQVLALFSPYGTGVVVLGLVKPDQFWYFKDILGNVVGSVRMQRPDIDEESISAARGVWVNYRTGKPPADAAGDDWTGVTDVFEFDGQGRYDWRSSIYLAAQARGRADDRELVRDETDSGSYTVIAGKLVLKSPKGQRALDLVLDADRMIIGSKTYYRRP